MENKLQELKSRLMEVKDLIATAELLEWDQATYMPPGGTEARARQGALLQRLAHEKFTDPAIGKLLEDLEPYAADLSYDDDDAALLRLARRQYERRIKIPADFMEKLHNHTAQTHEAWVKARPNNDFASVCPFLEKTLDLSRELANFFPGYEHIADPLIDNSDYGMKAATVREVFSELREQLVPLVQVVTRQPVADDTCLHLGYSQEGQEQFLTEVIKDFGFDFERGRQDVSAHPFTTEFSINDVRITVRYENDNLGEAMFSAMHEAGHAMYEQGINPAYEGSLLGNGTSSGVHESQSRLWENIVGRSWNFWTYYYPKLQQVFPHKLKDTSLDTFYRAINKVVPSLIRTAADEVTYNLHVMLRFDLELAMLEGQLAVRDLPDAWRARFKHDLGIEPSDDRDGVLQDIHWYIGVIGGVFQGYTLGNILSAQFYNAAVQAHPDIPHQIARGQFDTLHTWLKDNIYHYGSKYTASELIERVTGNPLNVAPYVKYLEDKYGELYEM